MCGGVKFPAGNLPAEEIKKHFHEKRLAEFKKTGKLQSFFWDPSPVLPVEDEGKENLVSWGNRDKNAPFPQTGWAKKESIDEGKWRWMNPKKVKIPVEQGFEKKVWFDFTDGTEGILVEKEGDKRVYMVTEEADEKYLKETHHSRMPIGKKKNFIK